MPSRKTATDKLVEAGHAFSLASHKRRTLLNAIADSFNRQATNRSPLYREEQMAKVHGWLSDLTKLYEAHPELWAER